MKKNFVSVRQIEQVFEARRIRNEQSRLNYYKTLTQKYIEKIDPELGVVMVRGSVPGKKDAVVFLKSAVKREK